MNTSDETQPSGLQKLFRLAASVAPGIFMIGYVIGTGSVTTMATAGADYGMSLTWTLVFASLFTHIMVVALSRLTILTGETTLFTFRNHFGKPITIFLIGSLMITQLASIIGVMAIVSDVMRQWTAQVTGGEGVPQIVWAAGFTVLLLGLYWQGRHGFFLKVLALLVTMMGIAFFVTAFLVKPNPATMIEGLVPSIPNVGNPALLIAGMIGTTMAGVVLVTRSVLVQEKGWTTKDFREVNRDSGFSMTLLFFINAAIMACAAGTLHIRGMQIEKAIDMVRTIEPLAGAAAAALFVFGILAAGLSSLFPNYLLGPWLISDFLGIKRDMSRTAFRVLVVVTSLFGLVVPIFGGSPVQIMIASQALSPLVMPLLVLFAWVLINKQSIAREHKPSALLNFGMGVTLVFSTYMLYLAAVGFINRA
jgi:Mn2+/Fe2+ NRAMP family transporter